MAEIVSEYIDTILKVPTNGKIEAEYNFNFDFEKFVSDPSYNFYDLFVTDCRINFKWNVWDLFHSLRKVLLSSGIFYELQWDSKNPLSLFLIGLIHCEKFTGKLEFENT